VAEELRFFLRTALYTGLITVIYWVVAREWAGTVMLAFLFGAALSIVLILAVVVSATRSAGQIGAGWLRRTIGFDEGDDGPGSGAPLELENEGFPEASIWPLGVALGALLAGLGAIFGLWLLVPGLGIGLAAGAGWVTQLET
jgi:hypothetical protein